MSRQIFRDVEEALAREVRRITFHEDRTSSRTVLQDTFDPITGDIVQIPIEPDFYDSSADTKNIQYPHFFIKLVKSREDRFTARGVPPYGKWCLTPVLTSPKAFEIITGTGDGVVPSPGNTLETGLFQIRKVQVGYLLRILSGDNIGTYIVSAVNPSNTGPHSIELSSELITSLPKTSFNTTSRVLQFLSPVDLNTVEVGDTFEDASSSTFNITSVDKTNSNITIGGTTTPDLSAGSKITRSGNVLKNADSGPIRYIIMDPSKPVTATGVGGTEQTTSDFKGTSPEIPIDAYYLIRIDSKERDTHVDVLNRVWEEFNPPRSALPVLRRTALSAEQALTADIPSGGSQTVFVSDNTKFTAGETIFIIDDLSPTKDECGKFPAPFESKIIDIVSDNQLVLEDTVPDTFVTNNNSTIVSNAEFRPYMFHFVDHNTRDVEGSQYWSHEFTFWVQIWVDKLEVPKETDAVTDIDPEVTDIDEIIII